MDRQTGKAKGFFAGFGILVAVFLTTSCLEGPGFFKQFKGDGQGNKYGGTEIVDAREESDGVVKGELRADTSRTQILEASKNGQLSGSQVEVPAGSLAVDTEVTVRQGRDVATQETLEDLDMKDNEVDGAGAAMEVTSSEKQDLKQPGKLQVPLPDGGSLALQEAPYRRLVVIYEIELASTGQYLRGILPRRFLSIVENRYVAFAFESFGTFQAAYLREPAEEPVKTEVSASDTITSDGAGDSGSNEPPAWDSEIADQSLAEDSNLSSLSLNAAATDKSEGETPEYSLAADSMTCDDGFWSSGPAIDASTGELSGVPTNDDVGSCTIAIEAESGGYSISQKFTVTVTNTNDLPNWHENVGDQTLDEDTDLSTLNLSAVALDPDAGEEPNYSLDTGNMTCDDGSWSSGPAIDSVSGDLSGVPTNADVGLCTFVIKATSGPDSITQQFTLTINNTNDPPVWDATIADQALDEDIDLSSLALAAAATDPDPGESPAYALDTANMTCDDGNWASGPAIDSGTGALSGVPTQSDAGNSCTIKILATSGADTLTDSFTLTVNPVNDAPTLDVNNGISLPEGGTVTIGSSHLSSSDVDDYASAISYTVESAPTQGALKLGGTGLVAGGTFTQDDVQNSLLDYVHPGGSDANDYFGFSVTEDSNAYAPGATYSSPATFSVTVKPTWTVDSTNVTFDASESVGTEDTMPHDVTFKPDGSKAYIAGSSSATIYEYFLGTPGAINSTSSLSSFDISTQDSSPADVAFKSDGTKMYVVGDFNDSVFQYSLGTAWDVTTATFDSKSLTVSTAPQGITFSGDGSKMYVIGGSANKYIYSYSLGTNWDVSTGSSLTNFQIDGQAAAPAGFTFGAGGKKLFVINNNFDDTNDKIHQYSLSTAYDLATATYDSVSFDVSAKDTDPTGLDFSADGTMFYVSGNSTNTIYQFKVTE